jgi:DNA-binding MarR family transcriptional regulator
MVPEFSESDLEKIVMGWGNAPDKAILFEKESAVIEYIYKYAEINRYPANLYNIAGNLKYDIQDTSKVLENLRRKGLVRVFDGNKNCSLTVAGLNHFESERQIYAKLMRAISKIGIKYRTDRIEIPQLTRELGWGDYGTTLRCLEQLTKSNVVSVLRRDTTIRNFYTASLTKKGEALLRYINSKS